VIDKNPSSEPAVAQVCSDRTAVWGFAAVNCYSSPAEADLSGTLSAALDAGEGIRQTDTVVAPVAAAVDIAGRVPAARLTQTVALGSNRHLPQYWRHWDAADEISVPNIQILREEGGAEAELLEAACPCQTRWTTWSECGLRASFAGDLRRSWYGNDREAGLRQRYSKRRHPVRLGVLDPEGGNCSDGHIARAAEEVSDPAGSRPWLLLQTHDINMLFSFLYVFAGRLCPGLAHEHMVYSAQCPNASRRLIVTWNGRRCKKPGGHLHAKVEKGMNLLDSGPRRAADKLPGWIEVACEPANLDLLAAVVVGK